jgi:rSAM/selenodomain-associated transferase 2
MLSIIIPARNEEAHLGETLAHLRRYAPADCTEIIVAEGGSTDRTADIARPWAVVARCPDCTRAALMNAGAQAARGDVLFFLHADSFPPPNFQALIAQALADSRVAGGAFEQQFLEPIFGLRVVAAINRLRYRLTGRFFGDQGIFVRRDIFARIKGFPDRGILEDLEFSRRMRHTGRTILIRKPVLTSGRRFLNGGIARTFLWIAVLLARHRLGVDTERYAAAYRKENE